MTLEDEPSARKAGRNSPKEKEKPHVPSLVSLPGQGQDGASN